MALSTLTYYMHYIVADTLESCTVAILVTDHGYHVAVVTVVIMRIFQCYRRDAFCFFFF